MAWIRKENVYPNINGAKHITTRKSLDKFPGTQLGRLTPNDLSYDEDAKKYYFDRNTLLLYFILAEVL